MNVTDLMQTGSTASKSISTQIHKIAALEGTATSRLFQLRVLSLRFMRSWLRSPVNLLVQLFQYILVGLILGAPPSHAMI